MSEKSKGNGHGIGFVGALTIAFIVLKLTKVISWSWVWVLSPIWISAAIVVLFILVGCILILVEERKNEARQKENNGEG
jgi:fatty acid desaturase